MATMTASPAARTGKSFTPPHPSRPSNQGAAPKANRPSGGSNTPGARPASGAPKKPPGGQTAAEHEILFQQFFKSVGPRTYVAQVKRANNGNHYVVLTEGRRDDKTQDVRKVRLFVFSEDFEEFFKLLAGTADFVRAHPVPADVKAKRERFWAKQAANAPRGPVNRPGAAAR
jgi:Protein of unknown function (DUF3276)